MLEKAIMGLAWLGVGPRPWVLTARANACARVLMRPGEDDPDRLQLQARPFAERFDLNRQGVKQVPGH